MPLRTHLRSISSSFTRVCLGIGAAALLTSCGKDDEKGVLVVQYTLGANKTCEDFGVETIRVTVGDDLLRDTAACDGKELVLDDVPAGTHTVLVEGLDDVRDVVMDNLGIPADDDTAEVLGGASLDFEVLLGPTPAKVEVKWRLFFGDDPAQCSFLETKSFEVTLFEKNGRPILSQVFDCEVEAPGYQVVLDEDRAIDGDSLSDIVIQPRDANDKPFKDPVTYTFEPPGAGKLVRVTIECRDDTCTGSGKPDA